MKARVQQISCSGIPTDHLPDDRMIQGKNRRRGWRSSPAAVDEFFAVGAYCTHSSWAGRERAYTGRRVALSITPRLLQFSGRIGRDERFDAVPFFWIQQYGVSVKYVGHARRWDAVEIDGDLETKDGAVTYKLV